MNQIMSERSLLLDQSIIKGSSDSVNGLSVFFTIICIVDVFGVFPVIALPKAIIDCGYYGILVIASICSLQLFTAILLGKCWVIAERIFPRIYIKNRYPYSALAEATYGKVFGGVVTFFLDMTVFGGGIPNLIVASQNLQLLGLRLTDGNFNLSDCYWIIILGAVLCPVLWIGSPKDMKLLCLISVSLVISVFLLICLSIILTTGTEISDDSPDISIPDKSIWEVILAAYGIIVFQFDIHPAILTIQVDMKDKAKLGKAIFGGFFVSLTMFSIVTIMAVTTFGDVIRPSILETLPTSVALHLAAALTAVQLCLTSAISNNALYQHMEDCMEIPREFNHRRCLLRTILTILAITIAESVPRFDIVMSLIGGTLTGPLIFIFPPLIYIKMLSLQRLYEEELTMEAFNTIALSADDPRDNVRNYMGDKFKDEFDTSFDLTRIQESKFLTFNCRSLMIVLCVILIIFSISLTIFTTYYSAISFIHYSNYSEPCIYNVSAALINL